MPESQLVSGAARSSAKQAGLIARKQLRVVSQPFDFNCIAAGVAEGHGGLLTGLSRKSYGRRNFKLGACRAQPVGHRLPISHRQNQAEMRHWYVLAIDRIGMRIRHGRTEVRDDLVTMKIEINPVICAAAFPATKDAAVKAARLFQIVNRKGEVKGSQSHGRHGYLARLDSAIVSP